MKNKMQLIVTAVLSIILVLIILMTLVSLTRAGVSSGPNCPGMDPSWLGFCEEAQ